MDNRAETLELKARRRFLAKCGKFAIVTPPAMAVLLSNTAQNYAVAASGGHVSFGSGVHGNNGFGNGGNDGVPGNSGNNPSPQADSKAADQTR